MQKHVENSCGDVGPVNSDFEPSDKLTRRPLDGMGPWVEWTGVRGPLAMGGWSATFLFSFEMYCCSREIFLYFLLIQFTYK